MPLWTILNDDEKSTDKQLIDRFILSGDLNVLGLLYSRYMYLVYGVCLKYLKNREESQDAVMEIFEKLALELGKQNVENFKSWLYVLTKNFCLMKLRSEKVQSKRTREFEDYSHSFMENVEDSHPIDRENALIDEALKKCIEELKEEQKRCINLFYYESRCYREIAEKLKIDEHKVKSHLQNAKRNLKICLEARNGEA